MKFISFRPVVALLALSLSLSVACGDDATKKTGTVNNGIVINNGASNNGVVNNGASNNGINNGDGMVDPADYLSLPMNSMPGLPCESSKTRNGDESEAFIQKYGYDDNGNMVVHEFGSQVLETDTRVISKFNGDVLVERLYFGIEGGMFQEKRTYEYDDEGRLTQELRYQMEQLSPGPVIIPTVPTVEITVNRASAGSWSETLVDHYSEFTEVTDYVWDSAAGTFQHSDGEETIRYVFDGTPSASEVANFLRFEPFEISVPVASVSVTVDGTPYPAAFAYNIAAELQSISIEAGGVVVTTSYNYCN